MRLRIRRSPLFVLSLVVALTTVPAVPAAAAGLQEVAGEVSWSGVVAGVIEFFVTFTPTAGGSGYTATLDIPAQGLSGAQLTDIVYTATEIAFTLPIAPPSGATWRAARDTGATTATGELEQGATKVAFTMEMLAAGEEVGPPRPQTPQQPFPYSEREVSYVNEIDGAQLAGTLTVPQGAGPFPAVLLITGSGPQNRDEEILGHKPFWVIADHLSRRGVAVLRVDDRGVGGSSASPDPAATTSEDFVGDVLAGVTFLAARDDIAGDRIGLIGHSEGGIIAPMAAVRSETVAFVVLLAGPGVKGDELLLLQLEALGRADDMEEGELERALATQRALYRLLFDDSLSEEERSAAMRAVLEQSPDLAEGEEGEREVQTALAQLANSWVRWFLQHDPAPVLERVRCPVLALNGTLDLQVPCRVNLEAIEAALKRGGNTDHELRAIEGHNHLFQHCETGQVSEYGKIEETFSPEVLEALTAWIRARFVEGD